MRRAMMGLYMALSAGLLFGHAQDSATWSRASQEMPEWSVVVQQISRPGEQPNRKVHLVGSCQPVGSRQPIGVEPGADGILYDQLGIFAPSARVPTPMVTCTMVNYAAVFGLRHDIALRYAPGRAWALEGKVPTKADYDTVVSLPDLKWMQSHDPKAVAAYLKAVCGLQLKYGKYLLKGRFVDTGGFTIGDGPSIAKRFVAADGTSSVAVWNVGRASAPVVLSGLGDSVAVAEPDKMSVSPNASLDPDTLRVYEFDKL